MNKNKTRIVGALLLLLCGQGAGITVQNLGMGRASVTISNERIKASEILNYAGPRVYYNGIRELNLVSSYEEMVVRLDTALGASYVYFQSNEGLCLEVANEHGCLTLTDSGGASTIGNDKHITVRVDPDVPPTQDISWRIFDATLQPQRVSTLNDTPFVLECSLPGYTNRGIVSSADDLNAGEVGLVLGDLQRPTGSTTYTFNTITVVARPLDIPTPEPATGTLTLLALAGCAIRRRRK